MRVNGYPDLLSYSRLTSTTSQIKNRLNAVSEEVITGLKSDLKEATNGRLGEGHLLLKAQNDITQAQDINTLSTSRLSFMSNAISNTRTALDNIDTRAVVALNTDNPNNIEVISKESESTLRLAMNVLNGKHGERYLLSGDKSDTSPFAGADALLADIQAIMDAAPNAEQANTDLDAYFEVGGTFDTTIYQGSDSAPPKLPLGNGSTLEVDLRANSDEIKSVLRGLAVMATSFNSPLASSDTEFATLFSSAAADVSVGNSGLISLETDLGIHAQTLDRASAKNDSESAALALSYQNIFGRDQYEAISELQALETQLQASYTITSRLADLTLTNFLR